MLEEYLKAYLESDNDISVSEADVSLWSVREQESSYVFSLTNTLLEERIQPGSVLLCKCLGNE